MKKYLVFAFAIAAFLMSSCTNDLDMPENPQKTKEVLQTDQSEAVTIGDNLISSFSAGVLRSGALSFPDYYGGSYIDENNNFVILVKGDVDEYKEDFVNRTKSNNFKLNSCDNSYLLLNNTIEQLNKIVQDESKQILLRDVKLYSFGILDDSNQIFIGLGDCSEQNVQRFKGELMDKPFFVFKELEMSKAEAYLNPGGMVHTATQEGSIGYAARLNGVPGIVIAGHLAAVGEKLYYGYYNDYLGTVTKSSVGGSIDAAFCPVQNTSLYTFTNTTAEGKVLGSEGMSYMGLNVAKEGKSTGRTIGKITATNTSVSLWLGDRYEYLIGITQCDYESTSGDSGGVVYTDNYNNSLLGIHAGGNNTTTYFIPAASINSAFGLRYYY